MTADQTAALNDGMKLFAASIEGAERNIVTDTIEFSSQRAKDAMVAHIDYHIGNVMKQLETEVLATRVDQNALGQILRKLNIAKAENARMWVDPESRLVFLRGMKAHCKDKVKLRSRRTSLCFCSRRL